MNQDDPQACTKCGCMPEDILMLACSHDLCLNCASDRLALEMKKNKNTNVIVCQQCHEKTPLDDESIKVLKGLIKPQVSNSNINSKYQQPSNYDRSRNEKPQKYSYEKSINQTDRQRERDRSGYNVAGNPVPSTTSNLNAKSKIANDAFQGIPSKKTCTQHHQEEILYFCFDCKCECICPECVIHGKHKDHDVKTIRKSQPIVKAQIDKYIQQFDHNIETLLIKKSQIEKQIRGITQQNNMSKKQINQAFDDLRSRIAQQQKELISKCDQNLSDNLSQLDKASKQVMKKIDELKSQSVTMSQSIRKDEILFLNFYSRKYRQLQQQLKQPDINVPSTELSTNDHILSGVLDIGDQVSRVGGSTGTNRVTKRA